MLAAAVTAVAAALALSGCQPTSAAAPASGPASASSSASAPAPASGAGSASGTAACGDADYCAPADWDTARASTPLAQIPPFSEPLNVVISARSTVSLTALQQAMSKWETVSTASDVTVAGIRLKCISSENANVTGQGYQPQHVAWRLDGCLGGNALSLTGDEDHVRIWNQPVTGSKYGAWFVAASFETMCVVRDGKLQTAKANTGYSILHAGSVYHCVDGGPGSVTTVHPDGYNDAATAFSAAVTAAARASGWHASERTVTVSRGARSGEGGVPFSSAVYVLTVTA